MNIQSALKEARALLVDSDSAQLDAELLLAKVLDKPRVYLYTWPESELSQAQYSLFQQLCQRRYKGHPVAYLLGQRSFWNFDLAVNSHVLIPRPETELLVELSLEKIAAEAALVADLGTGSGAIALALASERKGWNVLACDISEDALRLARTNADSLALKNIEFKQGEWCAAFRDENLDAIISNPPYIDVGDEDLSQGDVRFEPELALVSGDDGLADIKIIAAQALNKLKPEGWLLLEHGYQQGETVRKVMGDHGYCEVETHRDLAGHERVTSGKVSKENE